MPVVKGEAMIKRCPFDGGQGVARADALKAWNRRWAGPQPDRKA